MGAINVKFLKFVIRYVCVANALEWNCFLQFVTGDGPVDPADEILFKMWLNRKLGTIGSIIQLLVCSGFSIEKKDIAVDLPGPIWKKKLFLLLAYKCLR